jgi:hypothetical protein
VIIGRGGVEGECGDVRERIGDAGAAPGGVVGILRGVAVGVLGSEHLADVRGGRRGTVDVGGGG